MIRKALAAAAVAGVLLFGGSAAANAAAYPPVPSPVTVSSETVTVGQTTSIFLNGVTGIDTATFTATGGGSLASLALSTGGNAAVSKPVVNGAASATFTAHTPGTHRVHVDSVQGRHGTVVITVNAAGSDASAGDGLAATGGGVSAAAVWAGVGAVGLGGIAVAAAVARRRAAASQN